MFPQRSCSYLSSEEGGNLFGGVLEHGTARAARPRLALIPPSLPPGAPTSDSPKRRVNRRHIQDPPEATLALPQPGFPLSPECEPKAPRSPYPAPQPGRGGKGRVLGPGALSTTRHESSPGGPGWGVAAGRVPPLRPGRTRGRRAPAHF
nr:U1 small nuclear ribonucleoprotein C-like [Equus caballus]